MSGEDRVGMARALQGYNSTAFYRVPAFTVYISRQNSSKYIPNSIRAEEINKQQFLNKWPIEYWKSIDPLHWEDVCSRKNLHILIFDYII